MKVKKKGIDIEIIAENKKDSKNLREFMDVIFENNRKSCQLIENSKKDENWDGKMSASNSELCKGDCDKCSYNREAPENKTEMIK